MQRELLRVVNFLLNIRVFTALRSVIEQLPRSVVVKYEPEVASWRALFAKFGFTSLAEPLLKVMDECLMAKQEVFVPPPIG